MRNSLSYQGRKRNSPLESLYYPKDTSAYIIQKLIGKGSGGTVYQGRLRVIDWEDFERIARGSGISQNTLDFLYTKGYANVPNRLFELTLAEAADAVAGNHEAKSSSEGTEGAQALNNPNPSNGGTATSGAAAAGAEGAQGGLGRGLSVETINSTLNNYVEEARRLLAAAEAAGCEAQSVGPIAIKIYEQAKLKSFQREACMMRRLCHPNIVRSFAAFVHLNSKPRRRRNQQYHSTSITSTSRSQSTGPFIIGDEGQEGWIIMPNLELGSCRHLLRVTKNRAGLCHTAVDVKILRSILYQVLNSLAYMHEDHQFHKDVKPDNILIDVDGRACLSDFDICGRRNDGNKEVSGTPKYIAPEIVERKQATTKVDIWSFGITALELATGRSAFKGESIVDKLRSIVRDPTPTKKKYMAGIYNSKLPKSFHDLVNKCLQKDPNMRPTSRQLLRHSFFKKTIKPHILADRYAELIRAYMIKRQQRYAAESRNSKGSRQQSQTKRRPTLPVENFNLGVRRASSRHVMYILNKTHSNAGPSVEPSRNSQYTQTTSWNIHIGSSDSLGVFSNVKTLEEKQRPRKFSSTIATPTRAKKWADFLSNLADVD